MTTPITLHNLMDISETDRQQFFTRWQESIGVGIGPISEDDLDDFACSVGPEIANGFSALPDMEAAFFRFREDDGRWSIYLMMIPSRQVDTP